MADASTANAYLRTKVLSASPAELRLLLIDGAIKFTCQGREALERKEFESAYKGFSQARAILIELITTIKPTPDPALAERVRALYTFIYSQLAEGGLSKDLGKIDKVIELLQFERETWVLLMAKVAAEQGSAAAHADAAAAMAMPGPRTSAPAAYTMPGKGRGLSLSA